MLTKSRFARSSFNMRIAAFRLGVAFILVGCLTGVSSAASMKLVPSTTLVGYGDSFFVDVVVEGVPVSGLGTVQFRLNANASNTVVGGVSDPSQGKPGEISIVTPLVIGPATSSNSGIGDFFWNAKSTNGILSIDNETFQNGTGLYSLSQTNGAVLPSGSGTIARFLVKPGVGISADHLTIALSDVALLNGDESLPLDSTMGTDIQLRCKTRAPALLGMSYADTLSLLTSAQLLIGTIYEIDNSNGSLPLNIILQQSAAPNTELLCGSLINLAINISPTGGIAINGGSALTHDPTVSLALNCSDAMNNCAKMEFSNDSVSWSAPENYASTRSWPLSSGDGQKTVFVKFIDDLGNVSTGFSAGIMLETTHIVTASAGAGGTISPAGNTVVSYNNSQDYTIIPSTGYHIVDVVVDNVSLGAVSNYALTNVVVNHTISASFAMDTFTLNAIAGMNGSVTPSGLTTVTYGSTQTYVALPDTGYHVADVIVDGVSQGALIAYTLNAVTGNHTINVTFEINTFVITATAGANGAISPAGATATYNGTASFTITPNERYSIIDVMVDGSSVGAVTSYAFANVIAPHAITATFADITPPDTTIVSSPEILTKSADASFTFMSTEDGTFECSLDSVFYSACTSQKTYDGLAEGLHNFSVRAIDLSSNVDPTQATYAWSVDVTSPALTLSTLPDGSYTNNATLNMAGTATDNVAVQSVSINNTDVPRNPDGSFSQAISLMTGSNTITTVALDTVGNTTTDTRTIILDQTVPVITITAPADNIVTNTDNSFIAGTVDKTATMALKINGISTIPDLVTEGAFSFPVQLTYGQNTIEVTATDLAMNRSTAKRTVTLDNLNPVLAVISPAQDIMTNQSSTTIQGMVADLTGTTVTVTVDSMVFTPTVLSGTFEQQIMFAEEKTYAITVTALDQAGNQTTVQRNIIYDNTPPKIAIDSVVTPTSIANQKISGMMEAGAAVTVACSTATVETISYPTATTWLAMLSNLSEGNNTVSVTAIDAAGNISTPESIMLVLDTTAPDTTIGSGPSTLSNATAPVFTFTSTESDSTFTCWLDSGLYTACTNPVTYANLEDGVHTFMVTATDTAGNADPTPALYIWSVDTIPPLAVIIGAPASPTKRTDTQLYVSGDDVQAYKYQLDIGLLSSETPVSSPIALTGITDGLHKVFVIGKDSAGNWQTEANATTASWLVDTQPPTLSISALPNGAYTNSATINIAGKATDNISVQVVSINTVSLPWNADGTFSEVISLTTGSNTITTMAMDAAGNIATDIRTIILDQFAPVVTITSLADNSVTNTADAVITGSIDKAATITIQINGITPVPAVETAATFSFPVMLIYGQNTIQITATDLAGNTGTTKRTVTLDNVNPVLSVTNPAQDISTNLSSILIQGTVTDIADTTVLVAIDGATYVPEVINGTFQQQLTFAEEKTYAIMVTAADGVGNTTTVQRNIIYDKTPPGFSIDPVKSLTNNSSQVVTGSRESGATVTVQCSSAVVGTVSYPTTTVWSVIVADMTEGVNTVNVFSHDLAGNSAPVQTATIVLDTHAPTTTVSPVGGTYSTTLSVILTANETATIYYTVDGSTPSPTSAVYNVPLIVYSSTTLMFFGVDSAGNREPNKSVVYNITGPAPKIATNVIYQGPQFIAQGLPIVLSARLRTAVCRNGVEGEREGEHEGEHDEKHDEDCNRSISGKNIVITIASGTRTQNCTGKTDREGKVVCTISSITLPTGTATVTAAFVGDSLYQASTDSKGVIIFAYLSRGSFIIGEHEATERGQVTFWGSQWSKQNLRNNGSNSSLFKGFADTANTALSACGGSWTAHPGNSSSPPNSIPAYMAVPMTRAVSKSGNSFTGDITGIAIVKTNSGYTSDPGHAGTGTVVGEILCNSGFADHE